jgi:hypothetical protein
LPDCLAALADLLAAQAATIDPVDLERGKNQLRVRRLRGLEKPGRRLEEAALDLLVLGRLRSRDDWLRRVDAVTAEQVRAALAAMLARGPALAITGEEASRLRQGREIVLLPHQVEAFREMRRPRQVNGEDASRICLATEKVGEENLGVALGEVRAGRFMPVRVFNQ